MQCSTVTCISAAAPAGAGPRPVPARGVRPFVPARTQQYAASTLLPTGIAQWRQRAEPEAASDAAPSTAAAPEGGEPETVFYEGSGSNAELALSLLLGATLIFLPLTIASIGRRLWITYRFTNKRLIVTTNSPVLKREVQVEYSKIKEIRSAPRAFGLWGDVVFFLKDGSRLPLAGLERYEEIVNYVEGKIQ